ncbi:MAG: hypothetical protein JOZ53_01595, partial [Planctomycetaceae bacterium]|nr:hypothetical protein [Planctomycetaceae bacterium]
MSPRPQGRTRPRAYTMSPNGTVCTQFFEFDDPRDPLRLRVAPPLPRFTLAYETYGRMNPDRSNVILLYHAM